MTRSSFKPFAESVTRFQKTSRIWRSFGFRLLFSYFIVFCLGTGLIFTLVYGFTSRALSQKDRELVEAKMGEAVSRYDHQGVSGVDQLAHEIPSGEHDWTFFRVAAPDGRELYLHNPDPDPAGVYDFAVLKHPAAAWVDVDKRDDDDKLKVLSQRAADGTLLQVGKSDSDQNDLLETLRSVFIWVSLPLFGLGFLGSIWFSRSALRPIRNLITKLESLNQGTLGSQITMNPRTGELDELEELVQLFNQLLGQIQTLFEGMKNTVDNLAHDLRTPLTRFQATAERALQRSSDAELLREALEQAVENARDLQSLVQAVLDISAAEAGTKNLHLAAADPNHIVKQILDLYEDVAQDKQITLSALVNFPQTISIDADQIKRALANLVDNALKYTPEGGQVTVATEKQNSPTGEWLVLSVRDSGIGISAEDQPKIWQRLYRADPSRSQRGLGLGASLAKAIVEAHRGRITLDSAPGQGSVFRIWLPTSESTRLAP